jgi:hypothetical protein
VFPYTLLSHTYKNKFDSTELPQGFSTTGGLTTPKLDHLVISNHSVFHIEINYGNKTS